MATFVKSNEDMDGVPTFTTGKKLRDGGRRRLLLVGTGKKPGQEEAGEHAIFAWAYSAAGSGVKRQIRCCFGPAGEETDATYDNIAHWLPSLWASQVATPFIDARTMRTARIQNIFEGHETIEQAMTTSFDPARVGALGRGWKSQNRRSQGEKHEVVGEDNEDDYADSITSVVSENAMDAITTTSKRDNIPTSTQEMARSKIVKLFIGRQSTSSTQDQRLNLPATAFTKTEEDCDGVLEFAICSFANDSIYRTVSVGTGIYVDLEVECRKTIYAHTLIRSGTVRNSSRLTRYYWGPPNDPKIASYACVQKWYPGLWKDQVSIGEFTTKTARQARIYNVLEGVETLQQATSTRFNPGAIESKAILDFPLVKMQNNDDEIQESSSDGDNVLAYNPRKRRRVRNPPGRPSWPNATMSQLPSRDVPSDLDEAELPTPAAKPTNRSITNVPITNVKSTHPAAHQQPPTEASKPRDILIPPPSMSDFEAFNIWHGARKGECNPTELQTAITVMTKHTPPMLLIQRAIFACLTGKVDDLYRFADFQKWHAEIELRKDFGEEDGAVGVEKDDEVWDGDVDSVTG